MSLTSLDNLPNCKCYHAVTHIIFDLDGTLLDTETTNFIVWKKLVEEFGKTLPHDFNYRYRGAPMLYTIKNLIDELDIRSSTIEEMSSILRSIEQKIFESSPLPLMKCVAKLIKFFYKHRIPMAIATSSTRFQANIKMKHHENLFKMMHHLVTSDDVINGKPSPEIFQLAAKKFPARPKYSSCLVFEDSPNGLKAARSAGMQCVLIPEIVIDDQTRNHATIVLKSLEEFEPELFGLPLIEKRKALQFVGQ